MLPARLTVHLMCFQVEHVVMNRICGLLKYFWAESLPPALWPFPPHYSKRGKISLYPPATTVTQVSQLLVHHSQPLHYYIIWQEMSFNESTQGGCHRKRAISSKSSPTMTERHWTIALAIKDRIHFQAGRQIWFICLFSFNLKRGFQCQPIHLLQTLDTPH